MTELHMGLIGFGIIAVVGVLAYNKWQEARQRKQMENLLKASHPDVLFEDNASGMAAPTDEEAEPGGRDGDEAVPPATEVPPAVSKAATDDTRLEPVLRFEPALDAPVPPEPPEPPEPASTPEPPKLTSPVESVAVDLRFLSPLLDFIAAIDTVEPVPAQRLIDAPKATLTHVKKPVRWIGYDGESGEWRPISAQEGGEYRHIRVGLQLVDRQGPAGEDELAIFAGAMQELADQSSGIADIPSPQSAFEAATALDRFCTGVDVQIAINVISQGQAFAGTQLRALAEAAGMIIDEHGRFVRRDDDGNELYTLQNQDAPAFSPEAMRSLSTHGLTFLLDVPRVAHGERVFRQMADLALRFAEVLRGNLVDDNRCPLSETSLEPIAQQIGQYQAMLAAQRLPAGSPLARRLFS
ncbi:MAG: cell division protein ZipA C-terminal FtsZ-binding domain-containing protein [Candidatus Accumulibacter sp.]|jgi:FtsZ-interacting cell division protein ZipA|nr:cell division protein ZipA C-terminal FtsZ-binding domain-containing protein [Accumulibacter sp.]